MKSLRFRKETDTLSGTRVGEMDYFLMSSSAEIEQETKPSLLWRFVQKTKKAFKPNHPPTPTATPKSSPVAPQLRELTFQSSSSINIDPVLDSAEWLNGGTVPVHALTSQNQTASTRSQYECVYTPTPSDGASSIYSQPSPHHIDLVSPPLEGSTCSQEDLAEEASLLSCQARAGLCHRNFDDVGEDESSSFEEAPQLNVLDMVRRAFSSANLRLLPSMDPTLAKLEFLRRVDTLFISSGNSSNLSESADIPSSETTTTAASANDSTYHIREAVGQKRSKRITHTRGQESIDTANGSFFQTADTKGQSHHGVLSRISLTDNAEDISDFFDIAFRTVNESQTSTNDDKLICQADNHHKAQSTYSFSAQSLQGVEMIRRQRALFAARLEFELEMQKEAMEAAFEKCYDTSDRLHEIDLLNLREDHEAEVKYLQDERDVALSQVQSLTAKREDLESNVRILDANIVCLNEALKEKTEEAEGFQSQAEAFWQENIELARQASNVGNPDLTQFYELTAEKERLLTQLRLVGTERDALCIQNAKLFKHCDAVYATCKEVQKEKDLAKRRFDAVLEEKSNDYSWHAQAHRCALELKPEDHEQAESHATAMARELYRREAEKVASLRRRLAEAFSQDDQKLRQQDEVIAQLSDEVRCSTEALYAVQHETEVLATRYQNLLAVVSDDSKRSELTCGLARDLQTSFEERMLFGLAFLEAELEIARGERYRRARICDLRDSIQEKDDELAELNEQLRQEQLLNEAKDLDISLRDVEIEQTVPALKARILELERIMELQALSPSQYRSAVITDLQSRLDEQTRRNGCYEHFLDKKIDEVQHLRTEWSFWLGTTIDDLQLARGFRDQRDTLEIECLAMRERFANELLIQPLVVPETMKTTKQIEEDQLENMHQGVLKQFLDTYKALPKWIVEPGCPGYEILRAEHMDAERARLDTEREKIDQSFFVEGQSSEGGACAWISQDRDEFF